MKKSTMKSYLSLIPITAKNRRKQNRLTLICIVLAVFLVASIFSMADIWINGEKEALMKKHGNYHVILSGISPDQAERIACQSNVSAAAWYCGFGEDIYEGYTIDKNRVVFCAADPSYFRDIRQWETEGELPQNGDEVMLGVAAKKACDLHLDDNIVINTPSGDFSYKISGFCTDDEEYADMICVYMDRSAATKLCGANGEEAETVYYVQFAEGTKLRNAIDGLKNDYGLSDGNVQENMVTVDMSGAGIRENIIWIYGLASALFLLVLIAGVLMISSCMNSNVAQRTQFFGMMRCIGASRKQVMNFVRLEALNWCKTAIPVGCVFSIASTWIVCFILKNLVGGELAEFSFRISPVGIVSGALAGTLTVLMAAHVPARRAALVSPVAAVSGSGETNKKVRHMANTRLFKVESSLGICHAVSAKKNLILLSLSFALTVILFLFFSACFDIVKKLLPSTGNFIPDISIVSCDNANSIGRELKDEISAVPGVYEVTGNAIAFDIPVWINGAPTVIDLITYDDFMFEQSEKSVVSGSLSKISGDTDYVLTIFNEESRLDTGDRIKIKDTELEIACVLSEGIGGWGNPLAICTEDTFVRLTGEEKYMLLNAVFTKEATEDTVSRIEALSKDDVFDDRREENQDIYGGYWVFRVGAYGFLAIIALITILNIMNSISMSVSARIKQYGTMRAVGMSIRQMTQMIIAEAMTYVICGMAAGLAGGLYVHRLITVKLLITHFGGTWKIPVKSMGEIIVLFVLACIAAVYTPAKQIRNMSITETINEL